MEIEPGIHGLPADLKQGSVGRDVPGRDGPRPRRPRGRPKTRTSRTRNRTGMRTAQDVRGRQIFDFHGTSEDEDVQDGELDEDVRGRQFSEISGTSGLLLDIKWY